MKCITRSFDDYDYDYDNDEATPINDPALNGIIRNTSRSVIQVMDSNMISSNDFGDSDMGIKGINDVAVKGLKPNSINYVCSTGNVCSVMKYDDGDDNDVDDDIDVDMDIERDGKDNRGD